MTGVKQMIEGSGWSLQSARLCPIPVAELAERVATVECCTRLSALASVSQRKCCTEPTVRQSIQLE